ncbi:hypothetical protein FA95DRAFT_1555663 [Auriscalpium vulgare]|uniref:Uncharacterized protein n=1 Tax=Auriscalpium vulgare TaxID=40419 RepID=A0ACB8S3J4_9AGAM|nr:hypothetical protein FA95DRAFT_1555663 [Auriscalpium vulgare]
MSLGSNVVPYDGSKEDMKPEEILRFPCSDELERPHRHPTKSHRAPPRAAHPWVRQRRHGFCAWTSSLSRIPRVAAGQLPRINNNIAVT